VEGFAVCGASMYPIAAFPTETTQNAAHRHEWSRTPGGAARAYHGIRYSEFTRTCRDVESDLRDAEITIRPTAFRPASQCDG
jgi:hypothetical protein